jgi:tripartite-type tricarboxylate transporter receptor subunit TctC
MNLVRNLAVSFFFSLAAGAAGAQGYPNKTVKLVVPFTAGSATDILARTVGQKLTEMWGQ